MRKHRRSTARDWAFRPRCCLRAALRWNWACPATNAIAMTTARAPPSTAPTCCCASAGRHGTAGLRQPTEPPARSAAQHTLDHHTRRRRQRHGTEVRTSPRIRQTRCRAAGQHQLRHRLRRLQRRRHPVPARRQLRIHLQRPVGGALYANVTRGAGEDEFSWSPSLSPP